MRKRRFPGNALWRVGQMGGHLVLQGCAGLWVPALPSLAARGETEETKPPTIVDPPPRCRGDLPAPSSYSCQKPPREARSLSHRLNPVKCFLVGQTTLHPSVGQLPKPSLELAPLASDRTLCCVHLLLGDPTKGARY